jgi:hypothetical protein
MITKDWQVVIWGHKLRENYYHSHQHIHEAWQRAFKYLGHQVNWFDNWDDVSGVNFAQTLFITEHQVDEGIPVLDGCFYLMHNGPGKNYGNVPRLITQTYTNDTLKYNLEKLDDFIYFGGDGLHMPWATDLLPEEIMANKPSSISTFSKIVNWVGTYNGSGTTFGNEDDIRPFQRACEENGLIFRHYDNWSGHPVSIEDNVRLIKESLIAPAICGSWQRDVGYICCRAFKNLSYGAITPTNSETVNKVFGGKLICNPDTYQLFYDARNYLETNPVEELHRLMDFVAAKHTYLNRAATVIECANRILEARA